MGLGVEKVVGVGGDVGVGFNVGLGVGSGVGMTVGTIVGVERAEAECEGVAVDVVKSCMLMGLIPSWAVRDV